MRKNLLSIAAGLCLLFLCTGCTSHPADPLPAVTPISENSPSPSDESSPSPTAESTPAPSPSLTEEPVPTELPIHEGVNLVYPGFGENAQYVIVIDAGHQAKAITEKEPLSPVSSEEKMQVTAGTTGVKTGKRESELNLSVALALRNLLAEKGYTVVMIRETENVSLSNRERALIANEAGADVFLHIHANGADAESAGGAMTLCQTAENPANGSLYPQSRRLSECILSAYCRETGLYARGVEETDGMTGINWATVPATILEMGFMTNPTEDAYMATEAFTASAAEGIAAGIEAYLR